MHKLITLLVCFPFLHLLSGCKREDVDKLRQVGKKTGEKLNELTAGARTQVAEGLESLKTGSNLPGVARLVRCRLRGDKLLHEAEIQVIVKEGNVELRGKLNKATEKARALELTKTTVGVDQVVDSLTIEE